MNANELIARLQRWDDVEESPDPMRKDPDGDWIEIHDLRAALRHCVIVEIPEDDCCNINRPLLVGCKLAQQEWYGTGEGGPDYIPGPDCPRYAGAPAPGGK